jgi:hypothetical protein
MEMVDDGSDWKLTLDRKPEPLPVVMAQWRKAFIVCAFLALDWAVRPLQRDDLGASRPVRAGIVSAPPASVVIRGRSAPGRRPTPALKPGSHSALRRGLVNRDLSARRPARFSGVFMMGSYWEAWGPAR